MLYYHNVYITHARTISHGGSKVSDHTEASLRDEEGMVKAERRTP